MLSTADLIFNTIKHGDEKHQAWLREKSYEVAILLFEAIAEYKEDAERYRWLKPRFRSGGTIIDGPLHARRTRHTFNGIEPFWSEHSGLDDAIDAARKSESEHG